VSDNEVLLSFVFLSLTVGVLAVVVVAQQFMIMQLNANVRALVSYLEEADQ
jgi:uncharacterized coiled-coil protein SlyX